MKKSKRIMALIGAILLVLLYVSTLIFAFIDSVVSQKLLMAAIAATRLIWDRKLVMPRVRVRPQMEPFSR